MAPSRDRAPRIGTNTLITIRCDHELIQVCDADFAEHILFPHEYPVELGPVIGDHQQFHGRSLYRRESDGSICIVRNQKLVERRTESIANMKISFVKMILTSNVISIKL